MGDSFLRCNVILLATEFKISYRNYQFNNDLSQKPGGRVLGVKPRTRLPYLVLKNKATETTVKTQLKNEQKLVESLDDWAEQKVKKSQKLSALSRVDITSLMPELIETNKATKSTLNNNKPALQLINTTTSDQSKLFITNNSRAPNNNKIVKNMPFEEYVNGARRKSAVSEFSQVKRKQILGASEKQIPQNADSPENVQVLATSLNADETKLNKNEGSPTVKTSKGKSCDIIQRAVLCEKSNKVVEEDFMQIHNEKQNLINKKQTNIRLLRIENSKISKKMSHVVQFISLYKPTLRH